MSLAFVSYEIFLIQVEAQWGEVIQRELQIESEFNMKAPT
jgi:hypothetical protein